MDILRAVSKLYGNCSQCARTGSIKIDGTPVTEEQLAEATVLAKKDEAEYRNKEYIRLRSAAYSKLNQDEMRYDDLINGTNTWVEAIEAIKQKYPKYKGDLDG